MEQERLKQENGKLAAELADQLAHHGAEMDSHTREFSTKVEGLEASVLSLQDELQVAKSEGARTLQICEKDKEGMDMYFFIISADYMKSTWDEETALHVQNRLELVW